MTDKTNTPAPIPKGSLLTTGQILSLERRSNITDDEALRFARAIESALLSKLRAPVADERAAGYVPFHDQPQQTGVGEWCAPGPAAEQRQTWLLRFADTDRSDCVYYDEQEARRAFAQAEGRGWNCYLFEYARRAALASAPVAGEAQKPVAWENFPAYLIDHCEGDTISEEGLQHALSRMLADPKYAAPQASEAQCSCPSGDGSLRHPCAVHPQRSETVRDAALEEAAQQCEDIYSWREAYAAGILHLNTLSTCASAIRALKSQSAALSAQPGAQKNGGSDAG